MHFETFGPGVEFYIGLQFLCNHTEKAYVSHVTTMTTFT